MILKRLELSGFKSFARKSALEFTTSITAIVGPNGSGKSNIAEAVRFVLGEQSIKSLRGKRGEDLIFNGTHSMPRQMKASVTIVFDNSTRALNVDYDEVSIRRVVYRDSTSEYLVNDSRVRLKDILEMLSSVHIGASSHHIISQGEADRILLASFKERRNMIEDALGLKIYHYKKLESERKLSSTNENLGQIKAIKKEIEPHLRFLEKQVAKIKQSEQLREELKTLYGAYFSQEQQYLREQKVKLDSERKEPEQELTVIEKSITCFEEVLRISREEKKGSVSILQIEESIERARQKKSELSRALGKIEGAVEYEEQKVVEENKKSLERKEITISEDVLVKLRDSFLAYARRGEKEENISELRALVQEMRNAVLTLCDTLIAKDIGGSLVLRLKASLETKYVERANIENEIKRFHEEETTLEKKRVEFQRSMETEVDKERENERELFMLQNKKTELSAKMELIKMREEQYNILKSDFGLFLKEAQALIGVIPHDTKEAKDFAWDRAVQEQRKNTILRIKIKLEEIGVGGGEILQEYKEIKERNEFLEKEISDLEKSAESLKTLIEELEEKINDQFQDGVRKINKHFQELFTIMFGGGKASIRVIKPPTHKKKKILSDEKIEEQELEAIEPEEGIDISVSLPRKKIKGLMMLSGGERALTSIALIFATTQVNPPPFLILDETDAALDEVNSRKYGEMLKNLAGKTQLILITHNRETMVHAEALYGVVAVDGVSRLLSVKFDEAETLTENSGHPMGRV